MRAVASDGAVVVVERGAEPRRSLRYPRGPRVREVRFTWRSTAQTVDSHFRHDELRYYPERRLTGVIVSAGLGGEARMVFSGGSVEPEPEPEQEQEQVVLGTWMRSELAAELPLDLELSVEPGALAIAPIEHWREQWQAWLYRRAIADALPAALPADPVGVGARWQLATDDGDQGRTVTTWEVAAIAGTRVSLIGLARAGASRDDGTSRWRRGVRVDTRVEIDLASFEVAATVERDDASDGWSALATTRGHRTEWSTLAITQ